ncbi:tRNA pseudouridine synthase 1 [Thoreauomyces humboldtii]|nr:tRNA pseudouridine synthase 1 [Thoreauomyces humboldtii]
MPSGEQPPLPSSTATHHDDDTTSQTPSSPPAKRQKTTTEYNPMTTDTPVLLPLPPPASSLKQENEDFKAVPEPSSSLTTADQKKEDSPAIKMEEASASAPASPPPSTEANIKAEPAEVKNRKQVKKEGLAKKRGGRPQEKWSVREKTDDMEDRRPKRKVALLMGYCGTGYNGMQINPGVKTIESELHDALAAAGAVSKDNAGDPSKIGFMRCARTDKGVHAAGQVVSLKMIIEDENIVEKINSHLPEQIRIWGYVRTNNSFHAKNACDSRVYEYFLPTYVLRTVDPSRYPLTAVALATGRHFPPRPQGTYPDELPRPSSDELAKLREYRITAPQLQLLRDLLKQFHGTNNCWNFTVKMGYADKSSNRYIMSFVAADPIVRGGIEWVKCTVHGQSFMLHQIRKMIGLAVMMVRTGAPASIVKEAFGNKKLNIPKAPALGLLLERPMFDVYNKKWATEANDREPVDFEKYRVVMEAFKEKWIYSRLVEEELETSQFDDWNRIIDSRSQDYEYFLTAQGIQMDLKPEQTFGNVAGTADGEVKVEEFVNFGV